MESPFVRSFVRPSTCESIVTTSMEPFVHVSVQAVEARGAHHRPGWWKRRERVR
jgi:hypothetical protein